MMLKLLGQLIVSFGQIGLFSLGGGNSMIKLMEHECVTQRQWLSLNDYSAITGISFLFPGLTGIKIAGLIGYKVAGVPGLLTSIVALNLPGLLLMFLFTRLIMTHYNSPPIQKLIIAVQYGALALLMAAAYSFAQPILKSSFSMMGLSLTVGLFILVAFFKLSPFLMMFLFLLFYMSLV